MRKKFIIFITLLFIIPITQVFSIGFSWKEASTFSLIVYDNWQQPSKPLPDGWSYLIKIPANLQTNGYYAESFIACDEKAMPGYKFCDITIAHRGTTSIWDTYEDLQIAVGQEPYQYYMSALGYVDLVKKYAEAQAGPATYLFFCNTGHSLGAILAELVTGSHIFEASCGIVFDSPGSKPIIQTMINQKQLPPDALERVKNFTNYGFSGPNAINTLNEQVSSPTYDEVEFEHEDFKDIPLFTIGSPGRIYYFLHYGLNQHAIINFYNEWHSNSKISETNKKLVNNNIFIWPIGFDAGYKFYISIDEYYRINYWNSYMYYMWDHNPDLHGKYKDENEFARDFVNNLKNGLNNYVTNEAVTDNLNVDLDNEIFDTNKPITPITAKRRPTLYDVINNNYDGYSDTRRQIYASADSGKKLYYAVMCGDVNFAEKLLKQISVNINTQHGEGHYSLLQVAIMMGYLDMVQLLLKYRANPELPDDQGNTALHTVAKERYEDAGDYAKVLIASGANPNAKSKAGLTPVMIMQEHYNQGVNEFVEVMERK